MVAGNSEFWSGGVSEGSRGRAERVPEGFGGSMEVAIGDAT